MKQEGGKKLIAAIQQVLGGRIYVSEAISANLLELFSGAGKSPSNPPEKKLSDREFEVLELIGRGKGTREVAEKLHFERQDGGSAPGEHQEEAGIENRAGTDALRGEMGGKLAGGELSDQARAIPGRAAGDGQKRRSGCQ